MGENIAGHQYIVQAVVLRYTAYNFALMKRFLFLVKAGVTNE